MPKTLETTKKNSRTTKTKAVTSTPVVLTAPTTSTTQVPSSPTNTAISDVILGIDIGTSSCIATIWRNHKIEVIDDGYGNLTIPSVVAFNAEGRVSGRDALKQRCRNPKNTVYDVKRIIGRKFNDPVVQEELKHLTYEIINKNDKMLIQTSYHKKFYKPEEILSFLLQKVKHYAVEYFKRRGIEGEPTRAVITVPAYFNEDQKKATRDACIIAGIEPLRLIPEPTSASIAYGLTKTKNEINVIVFDLGAGTLDVSLLNIYQGTYRVLATCGNNYLGGEDFDRLLMNFVLDKFHEQNPTINKETDSKHYKHNMMLLKDECEKAKITLSKEYKTILFIENFWTKKKVNKRTNETINLTLDLKVEITQDDFNEVCDELWDKCINPIEQVLSDARMTTNEIDEVLLVGGSSRMPKIKQIFQNIFNLSPSHHLDPELVVSMGASILGYTLTHPDDPFSQDLVLMDVLPLTLGIEDAKGIMIPIVKRNTPIPCSQTKKFTTDDAMKATQTTQTTQTDQLEQTNQPKLEDQITIKVFEGERRQTEHNYEIGSFILSNFRHLKLNDREEMNTKPIINVTMKIDVDGLISVVADEKFSHSNNSVVIKSLNNRLSKEEIEQLVLESRNYAQEDYQKEERLNMCNELESLTDLVYYNVFKNVESTYDDDEKTQVNKYIDTIKTLVFELKNPDNCMSNKELHKRVKMWKKRLSGYVLTFDTAMMQTANEYKKTQFDDIELDEEGNVVDSEKEQIQHDGLAYLDGDVKNVKRNKDDPTRERNMLDDFITKIQQSLNESTLDVGEYSVDVQNFVNNCIIWMNVNEHLTSLDYLAKLKEFQILVARCIRRHANKKEGIKDEEQVAEEVEKEREIKDYKGELMEFCKEVMTNIQNDLYTLTPKYKMILADYIQSTENWANVDCRGVRKNANLFVKRKTQIEKLTDDLIMKSIIILGTDTKTMDGKETNETSGILALD
jgi:L1 cell adhesion molecule like protein